MEVKPILVVKVPINSSQEQKEHTRKHCISAMENQYHLICVSSADDEFHFEVHSPYNLNTKISSADLEIVFERTKGNRGA